MNFGPALRYAESAAARLIQEDPQLAKNNRSAPLLVAVDFSDHSAAALIWAARIAPKLTAPILLLHVVHDPGSAPGYYAQTKRKKHLHRLEDAAETMMAEFLHAVSAEHPKLKALDGLNGKLVIGLPVNRILEAAQESGAQMIVMGSSGRTGLPHFLLGSKAQRVAQLSPIPVTIVKDSPEADAAP